MFHITMDYRGIEGLEDWFLYMLLSSIIMSLMCCNPVAALHQFFKNIFSFFQRNLSQKFNKFLLSSFQHPQKSFHCACSLCNQKERIWWCYIRWIWWILRSFETKIVIIIEWSATMQLSTCNQIFCLLLLFRILFLFFFGKELKDRFKEAQNFS